MLRGFYHKCISLLERPRRVVRCNPHVCADGSSNTLGHPPRRLGERCCILNLQTYPPRPLLHRVPYNARQPFLRGEDAAHEGYALVHRVLHSPRTLPVLCLAEGHSPPDRVFIAHEGSFKLCPHIRVKWDDMRKFATMAHSRPDGMKTITYTECKGTHLLHHQGRLATSLPISWDRIRNGAWRKLASSV